jgi:integron integrase
MMNNVNTHSPTNRTLAVIDGGLNVEAGAQKVSTPPKPKLLEQVRQAIRTRHYSDRTEKAYVHWIKRFIFFHDKRHPQEMAEVEIAQFLSSLATKGHVSASTQNQTFNAILFLYNQVLGKKIGLVNGVVRAKRSRHAPVVLTRDEVKRITDCMNGVPRLMAFILYGAGLRLIECCRLRVKDVDFSQNEIMVRSGKGNKDRHTPLPTTVREQLFQHLRFVKSQHEADLKAGTGRVTLPYTLERKYPNAGKEWGWQWVFPATGHFVDRVTGEQRRHHLHESVLQRAFREARPESGSFQTCRVPHIASFVCNPFIGEWLRH